MSSNLESLLKASLESADVTGEGVEINPVTNDTSTDLDEALAAVGDAEQVVTSEEGDVEQLVEAEVALESLTTGLESYRSEGGMNPQTADMYGRAVRIATANLPLPAAAKSRLTVSNEAFGGTMEKLQATASMEAGAREVLQGVYEAVKSAVLRVIEAVKQFIATFGKSGKAIQAHAQALKKSASATKGTPKSSNFNPGRAGQILAIGGQFTGNAANSLDAVMRGWKLVAVDYPTAIHNAMQPVIAVLNKGSFTPTELEAAAQAAADIGVKLEGEVGDLPGNKAIQIKSDVGGDGDALSRLTNIRISMVSAGEKGGAGEVPVPSPTEVAAIATKAEQIGKMMERFERDFSTLIKDTEKLIAGGAKVAAKGESFSKEEASAAKRILSKMAQLANLMRGIAPQYVSYSGTVCKAALVYGGAALKQYATAPAAAAAPAALPAATA